MRFSDGEREKTYDQMLNAPTLKDEFYAQYPIGALTVRPALNNDPGRIRFDQFFLKMYGDCQKSDIGPTLEDVIWLPKKWGKVLRVTRLNGVSTKLKAISAELDDLPASFDNYLYPPAGSFNCRAIGKTSRLSGHQVGIAIDISTANSQYWLWTEPKARYDYLSGKHIPYEIVRAFEKQGFIWGGKWYHFDTMHFEYRPEIIAASAFY